MNRFDPNTKINHFLDTYKNCTGRVPSKGIVQTYEETVPDSQYFINDSRLLLNQEIVKTFESDDVDDIGLFVEPLAEPVIIRCSKISPPPSDYKQLFNHIDSFSEPCDPWERCESEEETIPVSKYLELEDKYVALEQKYQLTKKAPLTLEVDNKSLKVENNRLKSRVEDLENRLRRLEVAAAERDKYKEMASIGNHEIQNLYKKFEQSEQQLQSRVNEDKIVIESLTLELSRVSTQRDQITAEYNGLIESFFPEKENDMMKPSNP